MSRAISVGVWSGMFGILTILLFGDPSVVMCGLICGVFAGLLAGARSDVGTPAAGARDGAIAGTIAGVIVLVAAVIRASVVAPFFGERLEPVGTPLTFGAIALLIAVALGAGFGASAFLRGRIGALLPVGGQAAGWSVGRAATWALLAAIIIAFPFLDRAIGLNWLGIVITGLIFILLALGLNIVVGYAGLLDLGYAAFFAIGAYTAALLSSDHLGSQLGYDFHLIFWIMIFVAALMAGLFGLILGAPTLPLRGDYLAIVTLGFGEIVPIVFRNLDNVTIKIGSWTLLDGLNLTGGEPGISPIDPPVLPLVNFADRSDSRPWYFLLIVIILLSIFLMNRLRISRLGRAWMAMREDELAAEAMGINIVRTKLLAFAMGATFSGFGGAYYASFVSGAFPSSFDFSVSVIVLCMVILGGLGNIYGVIVGGLIIELSDRLFLPQISLMLQKIARANPTLEGIQQFDPNLYRFGLFGLVLVLMMLLRPEGLLPSARIKAELHQEEAVAVN